MDNGFFYHFKGELRDIGGMINGKKDGLWGTFHANGQLRQEETWKKGKLLKLGEFFSPDGNTLPKGDFADGEGSRITYYSNGTIDSKGSYKNGLPHGPWQLYHDNGQLASEGELKTGLKDGTWIYYHKNGNRESEGKFENDLEVGIWFYYNKRGKMIEEVNYKNEN